MLLTNTQTDKQINARKNITSLAGVMTPIGHMNMHGAAKDTWRK